jgi:predicted ATP-dependent endonuclease of OLD family
MGEKMENDNKIDLSANTENNLIKLKKFRIKNYKSIMDSGDCYLTETITILAGKNESGKTSILEALEDFNKNVAIRESAKPIKSSDAVPEIIMTFIVGKDAVKDIFKEIKYQSESTTECEIEVIKKYPDNYLFGKGTLLNEVFGAEGIENTKRSIKNKWDKFKTICDKCEALEGSLFDIEFVDIASEKKLFKKFVDDVRPDIAEVDEAERNNFEILLTDLEVEIDKLDKFYEMENLCLKTFKEWIPNFILFSSFEDIFPNKIPFTELETNAWIGDLSVISDLNIATIKGTNDREKEKHKDEVNIQLNKDYEKFWTQDVSNLTVTWDSEHLFFWIKEDGYPYEPSMRSKGRQWHLAFYIKVSARAHENVRNIILIDEPGLFLHAKAQEDILGKLEDSAREVQLLFSTHSPYLLEADKLNRVRLIHRSTEAGTQVENKVHALADKETLTPILTAIGLELNAGISALNKVNNIVVEGPSDVYYLNAFKKILNKDSINFIFGGGAGKMPLIGTILHGWGGKVVYLYDNDQGKKDGEKNLIKCWLVSEELILSVTGKSCRIEDIFSSADFRKYVLSDTSKTYTESNSEYVKKVKLDKVLLAKKFMEALENSTSISLDTITTDNITNLFNTIESKFIITSE